MNEIILGKKLYSMKLIFGQIMLSQFILLFCLSWELCSTFSALHEVNFKYFIKNDKLL